MSNLTAPPAKGPEARTDEQELFPTVMNDTIEPMTPRHISTSPQIDLGALDFFAPSKGTVQAEALRPAESPSKLSDSTFSSSILSRTHLQKLANPHEPDAKPKLKKPRLVVLRGERIDVQYTLYPGKNYMGRTDDKPVDIDLENQEPADRIWTSRQHAVIHFEEGQISIEDLNSLNGTFVNRSRIGPNDPKVLQENDVVQVGTVQLKLVLT